MEKLLEPPKTPSIDPPENSATPNGGGWENCSCGNAVGGYNGGLRCKGPAGLGAFWP